MLSVPLWLSIAAGIWLTSRAFHMTFSYLGSFLVMTLLVVGVAVPTPGAIGGFHAMYQIAVTKFFGVPDRPRRRRRDRAACASRSCRSRCSGLVFMAREGLSLGRMREMAAEENRATSTIESPSQVEQR